MKTQWLLLPLWIILVVNSGFLIADAEAHCMEAPSGLVSWWPGDGNSDDITGSNEGTMENGAGFSSHGMVGHAFRFDGLDDYLLATDTNIRDLQQLTISLWVKHDSLPSGKIVRYVTFLGETAIVRYDGASGPGQLHFSMIIYDAFRHVRVDNVLQVGVFHHVAATYDGIVMRLYLDGTEIGSHAVSGPVKPCSGVFFGSPAECLDGLLDEVQIYNRALSPSEIQSIFAAGNDGMCKPNTISFNHIELISHNHSTTGWGLITNLVINNRVSPVVAYSVDGGNINPMSQATLPYYPNGYLYSANVTAQIGGSPADYNDAIFTWTVDDSPNDLSATAMVPSGIRQVPLSTNVTLSGNPVHPTISWQNPDPDLDYYNVEVTDEFGDILWQSDLPFSSYGSGATYTIEDFAFESEVMYRIRIEARDYSYLPFAPGSDIPLWAPQQLQLTNVSTVLLEYWVPLKGDLNGDHWVDIVDAIIALRIIAGVHVENTSWKSDASADGRIGIEEALYALQTAARLRNYPVLNPIGSKSVDEGGSLVFMITGSDPEGDVLTFSALNLPAGAEFQPLTRTFSWSPTYSQSGIYQVTFTVTDIGGYSDSETVTINVNNVLAMEGWQYTLDGGQGSGSLTFNEQQGGSIRVDANWTYYYYGASATGSFTNGTATIAGTAVSFSGAGTATHPYAPPSPFTMYVNFTSNDGTGSGTYTINFSTSGWPPSLSGNVVATRTSGGGITK